MQILLIQLWVLVAVQPCKEKREVLHRHQQDGDWRQATIMTGSGQNHLATHLDMHTIEPILDAADELASLER